MDEPSARGNIDIVDEPVNDVAAQRFSRSGLSDSSQAFQSGLGYGSGMLLESGVSLRQRSSSSLQRGSLSLPVETGDSLIDSIRLSHEFMDRIVGDIDSSVIARIGDSGDRVIEVELDEYGNQKLHFNSLKSLDPRTAFVPRLPSQSGSYLVPESQTMNAVMLQITTDAQEDQDLSVKDTKYKLPRNLDHLSYLLYLSFFGLIGVLTRYGLQKLFGPELLGLTSDRTPLYLDLPSNILGSFLMGWFGIIFKADVCRISEHLMVGITTGYMGSLTTFSGWNQKMLLLSANGKWTYAVAGIILGMFIVNEAITIGVASAEALRKFAAKLIKNSNGGEGYNRERWGVHSSRKHAFLATPLLILLLVLWTLSVVFAAKTLQHLGDSAVLWLGCVVAPPGVWGRWYLARLNGEGIGEKKLLKWLPFGTLAANVSAACIMAALAVISEAVNAERTSIILSGVELGFCGCLSTVSTFAAEVYGMRQSGHNGRAFAYVTVSFILSFALGTLIYSVPVWVKHYK